MVRRIVIVGGGSTGWMAAAYLSKTLRNISITLVESSDIPIIGVGESTIIYVQNFLKALALDEKDWMPKCNAVFKSGIRFLDFYKKGDPPFWYPFEAPFSIQDKPISRYWLNRHYTDPAFKNRYSYYDNCFVSPRLCEGHKTIRSVNGCSYAYHFDAGLFGEYLKGYAKRNGVNHVIDTVTHANLREDGSIRSISRKSGDDLEGDLYIDCSGFTAFLLSKTLKEPFDSYNDYLFNNKAVAMRIPYVDKEKEMLSYTGCAAKSAGWIWNIPLYSRIGTGYVYCDAYKSRDEAENEIRAHLGVDRVKDVTAAHIDIRVGKHRRTWVKNCVALGLAGGFIEPLESTGLAISQVGIELLSLMLRDTGDYNVASMENYNHNMTYIFELIRDFLVCHYALTTREDSAYWKDVKYTSKISDALKEKLAFARAVLPDGEFTQSFDRTSAMLAFRFDAGWPCILLGMNTMPYGAEAARSRGVGAFEEQVVRNMGAATQYWNALKAEGDRLLKTLPSHYQFLKDTIYAGKE